MKETLSERAYNQIVELIMSGEYVEGDMLSERELSEKLDISRTPIREALKRLSEGDLVEHIKNRGAVVSSISTQRLMEQFVIRELFEEYAIKKIFEDQLDLDLEYLEENIRETEEAMESGDFKAYFLKEREFHFELLRAIGNQEMLDFVNRITEVQSLVMLYKKVRVKNPGTDTVKEHRLILQALKTKDKEGALQAIREHSRKAKNRVRALGRNG